MRFGMIILVSQKPATPVPIPKGSERCVESVATWLESRETRLRRLGSLMKANLDWEEKFALHNPKTKATKIEGIDLL